MPSFPTSKAINKEMSFHIYGQKTSQDKQETIENTEWIDIVKNDPIAVYIGSVLNTKIVNVADDKYEYETTDSEIPIPLVPSTIVQCRVLSIMKSFIMLLHELTKMEVIKANIQNITWKMTDWLDGAPNNGNTMLCGLVWFEIDRECIKDGMYDKVKEFLLNQRKVWLLGFGQRIKGGLETI